jgi:hypothetical protein
MQPDLQPMSNIKMTKLAAKVLKLLLGVTAMGILATAPYYIAYYTLYSWSHIFTKPASNAGETVAVWVVGFFEAIAIVAILYGSLVVGEWLYKKLSDALYKIIHPLTK